MTYRKSRKGFVFFTTLVLLSIVVLMCSALSIMLYRNSYTVKTLKYCMQAQFLAEAGVEEALVSANNDFAFTPSGYPKNLGDGTYNITATTYPGDSTRRLIRSTGAVKGISRNISIQLKYIGPPAFNYVAMGGGRMRINFNSVINGAVHSNSLAAGWFDPAVRVGGILGAGTVNGNASACGEVRKESNGTITGNQTSGAPSVALPPFDSVFFQYYYDLAAADGAVYNPSGPLRIQTFNSNPCTGPNHVVYVNGTVYMEGDWEMTGCIVATNTIWINFFSRRTITQHKWQNLPAFMSINRDVVVTSPTNIEGLVFAGGSYSSINFLSGSCLINGCVLARGTTFLSARTTINYVKPNPPGLASGTIAVNIVSWSES